MKTIVSVIGLALLLTTFGALQQPLAYPLKP